MKKILFGLGILWVVSSIVSSQTSFAATPASLSGSTNIQYACSPPYLSQAAKPNIHFVVDITGSMKGHPYLDADNTYDTGIGYWGYFKQDKYYKYDVTANNYWQENPNCINTDLIGTTNGTTGQCISGKILNYFTANKYDIMRKILTGGRVWASDATVLEHELGNSSNLSNEATTNCDVNNATTGKTIISSPNPTVASSTTISSSSKNTTITVAKSGTTATFTRTAGGNYTTSGITPGTLIVTSGFANSGNNGTWTVALITNTVITVTSNTGIVAESKKNKVLIQSVAALGGPVCKILANSINVPMTVDSTNRMFTRTDTGSFISDGWVAGMTVESWGFSNSGNNSSRTISSVTAKTITVSSGTSMVTSATATNARLTQLLTAYIRVKTTTPEEITGIVQTLYKGPGNVDTKADLEISFYDTSNHIDYTGGSTNNSTVKNQAQANYINAINGSSSSGNTNTGPALVEAEKFFKQVAVDSATVVPTTGTLLIAPKNGASDPYYDVPGSGTATNTNSPAAPCRKSFVILISDGEWNTGTDPVGPAYNMHRRDGTHDLRDDVAEPGMLGKQSVTTYTVYAFGDTAAGRNALITTAIFGGFDDNDNNTLPYPFTSWPVAPPYSTDSTPLKTAIKTSGYTSSLSVAGTTNLFNGDNRPTFPMDECNPDGTWNASCAEWDRSPGPTAAEPTLKHTGLPYNYFEATDGEVLATAMINAVNDILARTSSSTAASILGNNDNAGATLVQALFYPEKQFDGTIKASWIGEVQAFWYYLDPKLNNVTIREDTNTDQKLTLSQDKVAEFTFDGTYTTVNLYADSNGDGAIDHHTIPPTSPDGTVELEKVNTLWRAGQTLWARNADDRTIYTNDPTVSAVTGSRMVFDSSHAATLQPYLDVSTVTGAVPTATEVINYTRGTDISSSYNVRHRAVMLGSTTNTWKLGDIINSTPRMQSEVRLNSFNLKAPAGYSDMTYDKYIKSKDYNQRGTAYLGANDGMLHAFKTGSNFIGSTQGVVAEIKNADGTTPPTDLGKELWAFIPKNSLPYLQYRMLPSYQHMYFVDSTPLLVDASIGMTNAYNKGGTAITNPCSTSTDSTYYLCARRTTVSLTNQLDYSNTANGSGTSWRTVLLGSTGLGGASSSTKAGTNSVSITVASSGKTFTRTTGSFVTDGWAIGKKFTANGFTNAANNSTFTISSITDTVITCSTATGLVTETSTASLVQNVVKTPISNLGYSSFFALDVTDSDPKLLWEFSDPRLGFTTVTPVVVRIKDSNDTAAAALPRNGEWYVILASGPTGPINGPSSAFEGKSEQPMTIFVLDLKTGALVRTFNKLASTDKFNADTGLQAVHTQMTAMPDNAFGGSLSAASIDVDKSNTTLPGSYSDDAVYLGYTRAGSDTPVSWNKGGVLRLLLYNDPTPSNWSVSTVIDNIGPVMSAVTKLQDISHNAHKLWLFFGTGRYFVKADDPANVQTLFGIQDTCYYDITKTPSRETYRGSISAPCTDTLSASTTAAGLTSASAGTLVDKSTSSVTATTVNAALASDKKGWYINLGGASGSNYPKRVITNPVASTNGVVTFTTFTPSTNVCTYGGTTSVWTVKYDTGGVGAIRLKGQILIQLSTGAFQQIDVSSAFVNNLNRETDQYQGVPPTTEPAITTNANHTPSKRVLHIQER